MFKTKKLGVANKLHRFFVDKLKLNVLYEGRIIIRNERIGYGILDTTNFAGSTGDIVSAIYEAEILNSEDEFEIFKPRVEGLGITPLRHPLLIGSVSRSEEAVIFPEELLKGTFEGVKKEFRSAGEAFLYYMGRAGGLKYADNYKRLFSIDGKNFLEFLLQVLTATGACSEAKLLKYDEVNGKVHLSFSDLFECRGLQKEKPNSQFFRGFIAGLVSGLWKTDVKVEEVTCVATGSDFCQFLVTKENLTK
jgi:predicted hydrocarbon binding protein